MKKLILSFITALLIPCANPVSDGYMDVSGMNCELLTNVIDLNLYSFVPFTHEEWPYLSDRDKLERRQILEDFLQNMTTKALFFQFAGCDLSPSYGSAKHSDTTLEQMKYITK